jgi:putative ABC transport system permease protein
VRRTAEIGLRMALGAQRRDVEWLLLRQGAGLALAGVTLGLLAAFALTRLLASFLYGVGAGDPGTFAVVGAALFTVAVTASWIPAYRAATTDAVVALRHD